MANSKMCLFLLIIFLTQSTCSQVLIQSRNEPYKGHVVEEKVAFKHAVAALIDYAVYEPPSLILDDVIKVSWKKGRLADPVMLYDINGALLYYSYPVLSKENAMLGRIRIAANKLVGTAISLVEFDKADWEFNEAEAQAVALSEKMYPGWQISKIVPVVHDAPRVGVMAMVNDPKSEDFARVVVDLKDLSIAPEVNPDHLIKEQIEIDDHVSWSVLKRSIKHGEEQFVKNWEADHDWAIKMEGLMERAGSDSARLRDISLEDIINIEILRKWMPPEKCEIHVSPVRAYYKMSRAGYCTAAVGRMIASRYNVWHSEKDVATIMGLPYPTLGNGEWATAEEELQYYRDDPKGLKKVNSKVIGDKSILTNTNSYKKEIVEGRPSNLRKWSTLRWHHSRVLAGIRICGTKVQLGLLSPNDAYSKYSRPEHWITFKTINPNSTIGEHIGGYDLDIGGWVVVRE